MRREKDEGGFEMWERILSGRVRGMGGRGKTPEAWIRPFIALLSEEKMEEKNKIKDASFFAAGRRMWGDRGR